MNKVDYIKHYLALYLNDHGFIRFFYKNFHKIDKNVYRSSQPSPVDIRKLKKIGIKTIVNLRFVTGASYYLLEKEACDKHDINIINYPLRSRELPNKDELLEAKKIIENLDYPCLFHCKSGADRAGFMSALYFMYKKNDLKKAIEQLHFKYGHVKKSKTGVLDLFFSEYKNSIESGKKLNFNNWVVKIYDKDKIQRKHKYSNTLNIISDYIMRRE
jgi:protein tyrosine/serine phosphatase